LDHLNAILLELNEQSVKIECQIGVEKFTL